MFWFEVAMGITGITLFVVMVIIAKDAESWEAETYREDID
jgi:hypothetical protein